MTNRVILARHGNTFKPEDTTFWVGGRTDMPLVEKGLEQSHILAGALLKAQIKPKTLLTGPLQRTRQMAEIVAKTMGMTPSEIKIDDRLREIDYGSWEGKNCSEIAALGGGEELEAWNKYSTFPYSPGWSPSKGQLLADAIFVLAECEGPLSLIITSNGIMRFFAQAAINAADFPERKVGTGHICIMESENYGDWRITHWNQPPHILSSL